MSKKIIIPIPTYGFDPTEAAIPWKCLQAHKFEILFATAQGNKAQADIRMLTGKNLGIWKNVLRARQDAVDAYYEMEKSEAFCRPLKYTEISEAEFGAILLPGGHDKAMKEYLESKTLQQTVAAFFAAQKPVAAICHGVILAARSIDPLTKKSVIFDYTTTSLLQSQELLAYQLTRWWLKDYYLTYPGLTVEKEVKNVLSNKKNFIKGPMPFSRDDMDHLDRGFTVRDRNYLSARWPGDAYQFSVQFINMLQEK